VELARGEVAAAQLRLAAAEAELHESGRLRILIVGFGASPYL
jgi:hypothetical protein